MQIPTLRLLSVNLLQAMHDIIYIAKVGCDWCISILTLFHCSVVLLLCILIVGIHASGISISLFLLILLGWSPMWIASLTLRVYQWGSRSMNMTSFQIGWWPVWWACSETAEVWVRASCVSLSCSLILFPMGLPVDVELKVLRLWQQNLQLS